MLTDKTQETLKYLEELTEQKLSLGSFIMSIRKGEEMTQVEFAKSLGISRQVLCDIEHGRRFISPKKAAEYAKILGYSTNQFVRLCLQDLLDRDNLGLKVNIEDVA